MNDLIAYTPEMRNLPFLRLLINQDYPVIHPDWIKQIDIKKLAALQIAKVKFAPFLAS